MLGDEDFQGIEKFKEMSIYPYVKESRNWFWNWWVVVTQEDGGGN